MTVKQISVFVENKEGKLAEFTDILAQHGVDMRALSLAGHAGFRNPAFDCAGPGSGRPGAEGNRLYFFYHPGTGGGNSQPARQFFQCAENPFPSAYQRRVYLCVHHSKGRLRLHDLPGGGQ